MFQLLNSKFRSYIDSSSYITKFTPHSEETKDITGTSMSSSPLSKTIFESEKGKVHPGMKAVNPLVIDGVKMIKPVAVAKFHSIAQPGHHF